MAPSSEDSPYLNMTLSWSFTGDVDVPYICSVGGRVFRVCIDSDYPVYADYRYSLIVEQQTVAAFNKWPRCWKRPRRSWLLPLLRMRIAAGHIWRWLRRG